MKLIVLFFNIVLTAISLLCAVVSLFSLRLLSVDASWIITIVAILLFVLYVIIQITQYNNARGDTHIVTHDSKDKVNAYLFNWLNGGSRAVIFTRDLTWADESDQIRSVLEKKAKKNELSICLYKSTSTTEILKKYGAEIIEHGLPANRLKSRFIIIDYGTNNPRVTVGIPKGNGMFQNEKYTVDANPNAVHAFIELFEVVRHFYLKQ